MSLNLKENNVNIILELELNNLENENNFSFKELVSFLDKINRIHEYAILFNNK
jgi:hypothetical protein